MKKLILVLVIMAVVILTLTAGFAAGNGPKCPNPGGNSNGVCAKLTNCRDAILDTNDISNKLPVRVCLFGSGSAP